MLVLDRNSGKSEDDEFRHFAERLDGSELIVLNNARVIPARVFGRISAPADTRSGRGPGGAAKPANGAEIEVLLTRCLEGDIWEALVRPGKKVPMGTALQFGDGELTASVIAHGERGARTLRFESQDERPVAAHLTELGHTPLPPYIRRADEPADRERYQTVFAKRPGAIAAPTAGLHFTPGLFERLRARGIETCELTLDVGLGTFQPVRVQELERHRIHAESYEIPVETAERISAALAAKRTVLAVGTTTVRALEDAARRAAGPSAPAACGKAWRLPAGRASAEVFIYPGFEFRVVGALLTNFHLPRSTLLALVAAFAGRESVLAAYRHAVQAGYRFYSYGDCMLLR